MKVFVDGVIDFSPKRNEKKRTKEFGLNLFRNIPEMEDLSVFHI